MEEGVHTGLCSGNRVLVPDQGSVEAGPGRTRRDMEQPWCWGARAGLGPPCGAGGG